MENIVFNAGKHHLQTIRGNIRNYAKQGESFATLLDKLVESGGGLIDIYAGKLSIDEIKAEVYDFLRKNNLLTAQSYNEHLEKQGDIKRRGYYMTLNLSDASEITLRKGEDEQSFVHIHPSRHSPNTFRIRANTMKTAALAAFLGLCRDISPYTSSLLEEARKKLGLPPAGDNPSAIYNALEQLGFSKPANSSEIE